MECNLTRPNRLSKSFVNSEIFLPATPNDIREYYQLQKCPKFIFTHNGCNCYPTLYMDDKKMCCNC